VAIEAWNGVLLDRFVRGRDIVTTRTRCARAERPAPSSKEASMSHTTHSRGFTRTAAATLAALALAAPAATAGPIIEPPIKQPTEPTPARPAPVRATDESFDWGSAGIGAGATGGLILVAAAGLAAAHRARTRLAP
jgi:hypothetical protein